jgi:GNAT superfamily N-acetyltransferase
MIPSAPDPARPRADSDAMRDAAPGSAFAAAPAAVTRWAPGGAVAVTPVAGRGDVRAFVRLPHEIYRNDPNWIAPLDMDVRALLDRARHPFHQHSDTGFFLARRGKEVVGRIAAVINHRYDEFHGERGGFFGLFESIDDAGVAGALLDAAEGWLCARGAAWARGPLNLSTNDELFSPGVLIDGFDSPPFIMMAHTPPYYAPLLESAGYGKSKDLVAYFLRAARPIERLARMFDRMREREDVNVRSLNMRDFDAELQRVQDVYNSAWERNWGFSPLTDAEIAHMAKQLRPVINPRLCAIAEVAGEPVGFALSVPDYNQALRHLGGRLLPTGFLKLLWYRRSIDRARVITLGLRPGYRARGIDALMMHHVHTELLGVGIGQGECSWILEDNWEMRRSMERSGGTVYKTYRVFEKPLES